MFRDKEPDGLIKVGYWTYAGVMDNPLFDSSSLISFDGSLKSMEAAVVLSTKFLLGDILEKSVDFRSTVV